MHHHNKHGDGEKIHHFDVTNVSGPLSLLTEFEKTGVFGGGSLGKAFSILKQAKADGAKIFLSLAGAMIPGGLRLVVVEAIRTGLVDLIVTTGANVTHDLIEAFGKPHMVNVGYTDDNDLRERGIDRVYDAFVDADGFPNLEDNIQVLIDEFFELNNKNNILQTASYEITEFLGSKLEDEDSFVRQAFKHQVPIFVPVIADSVLGLQIWLKSQFKKIYVDEMKDLTRIQDLFHDSPKTCALILGGGVPKNYMLQSSLMSNKEYEYGVQITMDRVETGGLSGATLEEAVSWGKFTWEAPKATVYADTTIVFPLIVAAWKEHPELQKKS